jgi:putative heme-binding domain-containing protein
VNFVNAPDGTLHVVDMYRENIEHPWSIPDDIHAAVDLESGRERGRLWRLTPPNFKATKPPRLGHATTAELVATLENPNSWWRETAQRLLFERQDPSAVPALRKMLKRGRIPQARLHALWSLAALNSLDDGDVLAGLKDEAAGVRENAVKLAEGGARRPARAADPERDAFAQERRARSDAPYPSAQLIAELLKLASDSDACVRFQLAFTLGEITDPRAADALATIAARDAADPWIRTAVLSSVPSRSDQLLTRLLADEKFVSRSNSGELIRDLAQIIGVRGQTPEMERVLRSAKFEVRGAKEGHLFPLTSHLSPLVGLGDGLKRSGKSLRRIEWDAESNDTIDRLLSQAARTSADSQAPIEARVAAIHLLTFDTFDRVSAALAGLVESKQPQEVQRAAVTAIGSFSEPETISALLPKWRASAPAVRAEIVLTLLNGRNRVLPLLQAIENGVIPANQIPFARRATLLRSADPQVKELAAKLFADASPRPRMEVIAKYQTALSLKGDADRGRKVFETSCATCHRAGDLGKDVGPNLASIRQWNPEQVLVNILDPNREVAPNFIGYTVETKDGRTLDGVITDESATSLTFKRAEGVTETVLRRDIAQLSGSGLSLMPEGLEAAITVEQMADLIAFLLLRP